MKIWLAAALSAAVLAVGARGCGSQGDTTPSAKPTAAVQSSRPSPQPQPSQPQVCRAAVVYVGNGRETAYDANRQLEVTRTFTKQGDYVAATFSWTQVPFGIWINSGAGWRQAEGLNGISNTVHLDPRKRYRILISYDDTRECTGLPADFPPPR